METFHIISKSIISLIVLFIVTKIIGKKQVSQLNLFDYVIGISIGNFAAEMVMDTDGGYINGTVAMITFGLIAYLISYSSVKSIVLRRFIIGVPTIVIENGIILEKSMKRVNIDINDLLEEARIAGYFDISEIAYAIMEANGKFSFQAKDKNKKIQKKDLKIKTTPSSLTSNIIIDGNLMYKNIKNTDKNIDWFKQQLKIKGYDEYNNILLATYSNNNINIYKKTNIETKDVLE